MEFILSFLILALNLVNYETKINTAVFFFLSAAIVAALFYVVMMKTKNFLATCLIMMAYTWQISWVNIFGAPTSELQLPWLYIFGLLMFCYGIYNVKNSLKRSYSAFALGVFSAFFILFLAPLIISVSVSAGLKEFIIISFFVVVVFVCFLNGDSVGKEAYERFKIAIIWAVVLSSLFILLQFVMYKYMGVSLFKIAVRMSFSGGNQTSFYLLMEDHSSATIMLGCAIFYILDRLSKKNAWYSIPAIVVILVSMAITSRRTSTISFIVVVAFFVLFHYRGLSKKILYSVILGIGCITMLYYLLIARPVSEFSQILSDNGRFAGYEVALKLIAKNPFGIGYDDDYLSSLMPYNISPHNTVMRWAAMGGLLFALVLVLIVAVCIVSAYKKRLTAEFWAIIYSFFAANFIPDILAARFFVIICSMALLAKKVETLSDAGAGERPSAIKNSSE